MRTRYRLELRKRLAACPEIHTHGQWEELLEIVTGGAGTSRAGFPYICQQSFEIFVHRVRHLFVQGRDVLRWVHTLDAVTEGFDDLESDPIESMARAQRVLRTMVFTASVTAPPDLWLLRQILGTHQELGTLGDLLSGDSIEIESYAAKHSIDARQLQIDLGFLFARGYLDRHPEGYVATPSDARIVLEEIVPVHPDFRRDMTGEIINFWSGDSVDPVRQALLERWLQYDVDPKPFPGWIANLHQIETGYRLLPIVVALRALEMNQGLIQGEDISARIPRLLPEMVRVFEQAGVVDEGKVTEIGARVFARGPGPYGIIGSYHPYLSRHRDLLEGSDASTWVRRAANVAASQDANRTTFRAANGMLDKFCDQTGWKYDVFIEHAMGKGEATQQRFETSGDSVRYLGFDLEEDSIAEARIELEAGRLPAGMKLYSECDIGVPVRVTERLVEEDLTEKAIVMMVGNGFHEVRGQTNEHMIEIFKEYAAAGIVLMFVEESALSATDLRTSAWNTYHAGFRYVHEVSGQGLRPSWEGERPGKRFSWSKCARLGGYVRVDALSNRTRTIFPFAKGRRANPSISVTHFCVPTKLADSLGISEES